MSSVGASGEHALPHPFVQNSRIFASMLSVHSTHRIELTASSSTDK